MKFIETFANRWTLKSLGRRENCDIWNFAAATAICVTRHGRSGGDIEKVSDDTRAMLAGDRKDARAFRDCRVGVINDDGFPGNECFCDRLLLPFVTRSRIRPQIFADVNMAISKLLPVQRAFPRARKADKDHALKRSRHCLIYSFSDRAASGYAHRFVKEMSWQQRRSG